MSGSIKRWFEVSAFVITIAALVAIAALAVRVAQPSLAIGVAIATSLFTALFLVIAGIAMKRQHVRQGDLVSMSIKDELDSRNLRSKGTRIQVR